MVILISTSTGTEQDPTQGQPNKSKPSNNPTSLKEQTEFPTFPKFWQDFCKRSSATFKICVPGHEQMRLYCFVHMAS